MSDDAALSNASDGRCSGMIALSAAAAAADRETAVEPETSNCFQYGILVAIFGAVARLFTFTPRSSKFLGNDAARRETIPAST